MLTKLNKINKVYQTISRKNNFSTDRKLKIANSFKIYNKKDDHLNPTADPFLISTETGFLTRTDPVGKLPKKFEVLDSLLDRMRWYQPDGSAGLLAKKQLAEAVDKELPMYDFEGIEDKMLLLAIYRDYCFLASAYLLEDCHHKYLKDGSYGLARDRLPKNLAVPFVNISKKLSFRPFLEYNSGYSLNNWFRINKDEGITINNIDIFRSFVNLKSEAGFILVHVAINQHSGNLIRSGVDVLSSAEQQNRNAFNDSLCEMRDTLLYMNQEFERMYIESSPTDYNLFRTFILGIVNQPMFPKGVVYEGCYNNEPQFFRGESGANDSVIPFSDNIVEITATLPKNPLTDILRDFRTYRPTNHQEFLKWSEDAARDIGVLEYSRKDPVSLLHLLEVTDQIRAFRHRHWVLTNLYIMNFSKHPIATGGSPIATWLPNQLITVLQFILDNAKLIDEKQLPGYLHYNLHAIINRAEADLRITTRQVSDRKIKYGQ